MRDSDQAFFDRVFEVMMTARDTHKLPSIRFNNFYDFFTIQSWLHVIDTNNIYLQRYKSNNKKRFLFVFLLCLFSTVLALLWFAGFRLNVTASLPLGLYRLTNEVPQKGSIAFFCLESPEFRSLAKERDYVGSGFCAGSLRSLGKEVYGLPGDLISIEADGALSINNQVIPGSAAKTHDSKGRPMPAPELRPGLIPAGKALMLSLHHQGSFDGRYFGLVSLSSVHPVKPVFTIN